MTTLLNNITLGEANPLIASRDPLIARNYATDPPDQWGEMVENQNAQLVIHPP